MQSAENGVSVGPTVATGRAARSVRAATTELSIVQPHVFRERVQRTIDIVVATLGFLICWPIIVVLAVKIRSGTPGPAFFWQTRIGKSGQPFKFLKFRTLYVDARERFPELYAYRYTADDIETQPFKVPNDPRVTPEGLRLRKTSLDELPNLWNVLLGEMTLVGPRPEIPEMLPYYCGEMLEVFNVKPGLTGAAQVSGRANLSMAESIRIDVAYLRQRTIWSDVVIIARTVVVVFRKVGAF